MNSNLKAALLTIGTLSLLTIALIELSGVSRHALFNRFGKDPHAGHRHAKSATPAKPEPDQPRTEISFEKDHHSFGRVKEGTVVEHAFRFRNTGKNPLFIRKADVSCGYTRNRTGHQQKNVLIHSNAQQEAISIGFDAEVDPQ
jgi:hypothetical protein